jgi:hypothetical protein
MLNHCPALAPLVLVASVLAQSIVVPNSAANVEGNAADREPFGLEGVRHLTYIHQEQLAQIPAQTAISRLSYRRDTPMPVQVMRRPPGIWQIRMGAYHGSVAQPPSAWPPNSDPEWSIVFQPRQVWFPDLTQPGGNGPAPFQLTFYLDRPFVYRGTHIGIEHFVADGQSMHDYFIDTVDALVPGGTVTLLTGGAGCPTGQNRATGQAPNPGGGAAEFYLFGALPQAPAVLAIGTSDTTWAGVPLPLHLGPALPGCSVIAALDTLVPTASTSAGMAQFALTVPALRALLGASLYSQWLCPGDTRVSQTIPLTLSDGLRHTFGTSLNAGFLGMSVVSAFSGSNQFGYVQPNRGPVVEIGW